MCKNLLKVIVVVVNNDDDDKRYFFLKSLDPNALIVTKRIQILAVRKCLS